LINESLKRRPGYNRPKKLDYDWNSIGTSIGEKIDIEDIMDIQERTITFGRKKTPWEKIVNDLQDTISNTGQYVALVNSHLKAKKLHIEKIIELTNNFDQEIQNLKSDNEKVDKLSDTPIHVFKTDGLRKLVQESLKDREKRHDILKKLKSEIVKAEEAVHQADKRIEMLNDKILRKKFKEDKTKLNQEQINQLNTDLATLMKKYDPKVLSEALRGLNV